jgi:hypothetical protein
MSKYTDIVKDFNALYGPQGYKAEIPSPTYSNNLKSQIWVGRSKDGTAFGKLSDQWLAGQANTNSAEAKLGARFSACATNTGRRSYNTRSQSRFTPGQVPSPGKQILP